MTTIIMKHGMITVISGITRTGYGTAPTASGIVLTSGGSYLKGCDLASGGVRVVI